MQKKLIGPLKRVVCSIMADANEPLCAFDIATFIKEKHNRNIYLCNLYPALAALNDCGFLHHEITPKRPMRGGRKRKVYVLTEAGREYLLGNHTEDIDD